MLDAAHAGILDAGVEGEVLVVDNGCDDLSAQIAVEHGARVLREDRRGYGAALRKGFGAAAYDVVVMGDGDLSYDFSKLGALVRPILEDKADLVVGNRMQNILPGAMPWLHRYVGNPLLSAFTRVVFRIKGVRDIHCGLRAIRLDAYRQLNCVTTGMEFASEMIIRAHQKGLRIVEQPIVYHLRTGDSKLHSFKDGWRHLRFMMLHSPTTALLIPGCVGWLLGLLICLPLVSGPVVISGRTFDVHCMILGGLLNVVSIQIMTFGMLAKAFAHLSGIREDPVIARLYQLITFEKTMALALPMVLIGLIVSANVILGWVRAGFGDLDSSRALFFSTLCLVNGVQLSAAAYLFSLVALPHRIDRSTADE